MAADSLLDRNIFHGFQNNMVNHNFEGGRNMGSRWEQEPPVLPGFEELKGDMKTDVLIIGGGMAGILCA